MQAACDSWRIMGTRKETRDFSDERPMDWQAAVVFHDNRPIQRVPEDQRSRFTGFVRATPRARRPIQIVRPDDRTEETSSED